jgi:tRNA(Ile)-lysidine synthase
MAPDSTRERLAASRLASRAVLAVSGGADSMVMAALLFEHSPCQVAAIATFDHGTGAHAAAAAAAVEAWAVARGVPVRVGRVAGLRRTEAAWRQSRWAFLNRVGAEFDAPVATAHSRDDQAETVFIRLLRGSGVRGLAGLLAPGPVQRPMLAFSRADLRNYATLTGVPFRDDPSNDDVRHLRNRVRLELLPRIEEISPGFRDWLIELGQRAAAWRSQVADAVNQFWAPSVQDPNLVTVPRTPTRLPTAEEAALFWPEVAGRIGVTLDRRGTARLASFTTKQSSGLQIPLSGGVVVRSSRRRWALERAGAGDVGSAPPNGGHPAMTG